MIEQSNTINAIHPSEWSKQLPSDDTQVYQFRNLQHFKNHVSELSQLDTNKCGISYEEALESLLSGKGTMTDGDFAIIKNKVKNNLHKRGLISDIIYESYKYSHEGHFVDVAKVAEGDPNCFLVPNKTYKNHFYELYINISYPCSVSDDEVVNSMAKLLATIQLLEKEHYYCKITLVLPIRNVAKTGKSDFFALIPLFSHRDIKTIATMSSVLNERLLRKFFFAFLEDAYGDNLKEGYGNATKLEGTITPVNLDECELHSKIMEQIIKPCKKR